MNAELLELSIFETF